MRQAVDQRDVGSRTKLQMKTRFDMRRRAHQIDSARIGNNQFRAFAQAPLHLRSKDRVGVRRIRPDDHDHVRFFDRIKFLRAGGSAEGRLQTVARRGMTNSSAGVDVVVPECRTHEFLHQEGFFVRASR